jgi:c-di-GMP-binding flagellar brake protein YcgR
MMEEHRQSKRVGVSLIVRFRIPKSHLGMSARSEDISEGGMCLTTLQGLKPGMVLDLNFNLQGSVEEFKAKGEIVWQSARKHHYFPFLLGLRFIEISHCHRNQIKNFVAKISHEAKPLDILRTH